MMRDEYDIDPEIRVQLKKHLLRGLFDIRAQEDFSAGKFEQVNCGFVINT
jgi:hypothetical protein